MEGFPMRAKRFAALVPVFVMLATLAAPVAAGPAAGTGTDGDRHIVVFKDSVGKPAAAAAALGQQLGFKVERVYSHAIKGFAAAVPAGRLAALRNDPRVAYVEADQVVRLAAQTKPTGIKRIFADGNTKIGIDGTDDFRVDVDVAIIDTGIDLGHPDLNVVASTNCSGGSILRGSCGTGGDDDNGHGTHVAGTVAALDNGIGVVGVAPGARLHAVKVLRADGSGYMSWIVAGIDWVTARASTIEVANMSLGCECTSTAMNDAIARSVNAGVAYAVAAGNNNKNASTFSPANHADVLTVSALADFNGLPGGGASPTCRTDQDDTLADFSNWGSLVEITAPGVCILSSVPGGGYATYSGTSMASPHAAGALALLASVNNPGSKSQVKGLYSSLMTNGNYNWTDDSGDGVKEPLLDVSNQSVFAPKLVAGPGGGGDTNRAPTAVNDSAETTAGSAVTINVLANDSDPDGDTLSVADFAQGGSGTVTQSGNNLIYTPNAGFSGTDTFTYRATDGTATSNWATVTVTVQPASTSISLSVRAYKVKGVQHADLTWSGATSTDVDVYRDSLLLVTTANDPPTYTDNIGKKGGGSYTYKVCEAGTSTCSPEVTVTY
jgi:subtilisin